MVPAMPVTQPTQLTCKTFMLELVVITIQITLLVNLPMLCSLLTVAMLSSTTYGFGELILVHTAQLLIKQIQSTPVLKYTVTTLSLTASLLITLLLITLTGLVTVVRFTSTSPNTLQILQELGTTKPLYLTMLIAQSKATKLTESVLPPNSLMASLS